MSDFAKGAIWASGTIIGLILICFSKVIIDTLKPGNRYEIYQSSLAARDQFLLDKETGRVWQARLDANQKDIWQEMNKYGLGELEKQAH